MLKFGTDLPLVTPQFGIANGPDRPIGGRDGGPLGEIFDVFEVFFSETTVFIDGSL